MDKAFLEQFNEWVKRWLEKAKDIELESHRNYLFYISKVYEDTAECLEVFFRLSEEFFKEIHNKAD